MFEALKDTLFGTHLDPADRCQRCHKPIGAIDHHPIPVCAACWLFAWDNRWTQPHRDPNKDSFEKLMEDFETEARRWVRRISTRPTRLDVLRDSNDAVQDVRELGQQVDAAYSRKDIAEAERLEAIMRERMEAISVNRPAATAAADALERGDS